MKQLTDSVKMLIRMKQISPASALCITNFGRKKIKKRILILCSIMLDNVFGSTLNLPRKYPLNMEEKDINGNVNAMALMMGMTSFCFKNI